jgi:chemotaxis protein MotB
MNRRIELLILTSAQSRAVSNMFGAPNSAASSTLGGGASVSMPDAAALEELRGQLPKTP